MSETGSWTFEILKKENNIYYYRLFNDVSMHIRCPNISAYCDKSDSLYKKAWETLEDEHDCRSLSPHDVAEGIYLGVPFEKTWGSDNVIVGCDFVKKQNEKKQDATGVFILNGEGKCPIWLKLSKFSSEYHLYELNIEKSDSGLNAVVYRIMRYIDKRFFYGHFNTLAIKGCKKSKCEVVSVESNPMKKYIYRIKKEIKNISIKCDYMKLRPNSNNNITATLELKSEGVCPIEIDADNGKADTVYVRSIKTSDGYKALITNKPR